MKYNTDYSARLWWLERLRMIAIAIIVKILSTLPSGPLPILKYKRSGQNQKTLKVIAPYKYGEKNE